MPAFQSQKMFISDRLKVTGTLEKSIRYVGNDYVIDIMVITIIDMTYYSIDFRVR